MSSVACGQALRTSHSRLVMPMCSSARVHGKKRHWDQSSRLSLYQGHQSCPALAVEDGSYLLADFGAALVAAFVFTMGNPPAQSTPIATDEPPYETPQ